MIKKNITAKEFYNELWQIENEIHEYTTKLNLLINRKKELYKIDRLKLK